MVLFLFTISSLTGADSSYFSSSDGYSIMGDLFDALIRFGLLKVILEPLGPKGCFSNYIGFFDAINAWASSLFYY